MTGRLRAILGFTICLAMAMTAVMIFVCDDTSWAKGAVKSSGGGGSSDNESRSSARSSDSGGSAGGASGGSSRSSDSSIRSSATVDRSPATRIETRSPSGSITNRLDQEFQLRSVSSRQDTRTPSPTYRKDYADIGDLWRGRQEKRDTDNRRYDDYRRGYHDSGPGYYGRSDGWGWSVGVYTPSFRYRYYSYDYFPTRCYPSVYCYYYDYFPPYLFHDRVFFTARLSNARMVLEVPVFVYSRSSDYYLSDSIQKGLWAALRDIQRAWERSEPELIMRHVKSYLAVDVYLRDEYSYSLDTTDYYDMTRDAMSVIKTYSFDFDKVNRAGLDRHIAKGKHVYTDRYGALKTVFVSYTLERFGSDWYITAVGSSPYPN
ncbi:MAG: hypothetical protein KBC96_10505 [Armatimonadetes bacterium]|nr:hypothetical protein [Armatimonadota bacterium]